MEKIISPDSDDDVATLRPCAGWSPTRHRDPRQPNTRPGTRTNSEYLLIAAIFATSIIHLIVAAGTGLVDDEAYYRLWSLAPSLSYYDHPPMVAWMIGAGRALAGDTPFGVRLLAPVSLLAGTVLLWRTTWLLYGPETTQRAVWIMLAMPLLAVGGIIITPDLPSVLFAGSVLWALAELDHSDNANWWLAVGLLAGLGLISKYTNLFLGATIVVWLFAVPSNRKWFRSPQLWLGGLIAVAATLPVIIWNAEHDWASFGKQFGRVAHHGSEGLIYLVEFIGTFVGLASPIIAVLAMAGLVSVTRSAVATRSRSDVLIAAAVLPILIYFTIHSLHDRVLGNWPAPIYPPLAICAALGLEAIIPASRRRHVFASAVSLGFVLTAAIYTHAIHPIEAANRIKEPTEQMHGWRALADAVDEKRREAGAAWIATSSYGTTGQLAMALSRQSEVVDINQRIRYEFLPPLPRALLEKPALYVELERRVNLRLLHAKFRSVTPLGTLKRDTGSATGATYKLFLVSDAPVPPA